MDSEMPALREEKGSERLLPPRSIFKATAFHRVCYGVKNVEETRAWYGEVFGMACVAKDSDRALLTFGNPRREIALYRRDERPLLDRWAFSIADFDTEQVRKALLRWGIRGSERSGDFAWTMVDDNGFLTQICAQKDVPCGHPTDNNPADVSCGIPTDNPYSGNARGRQRPEGPGMSSSSRAPKTGWQATAVNHASYGVPNYRRTRDFYIDLFGMRLVFEDGIKCALHFGATPEDALYITQRDDGPVIDHMAISIADFDLKKTEETLKRLGLPYSDDGDCAWTLVDPEGTRVQVCAETGVYPGAATDFFHQIKNKL